MRNEAQREHAIASAKKYVASSFNTDAIVSNISSYIDKLKDEQGIDAKTFTDKYIIFKMADNLQINSDSSTDASRIANNIFITDLAIDTCLKARSLISQINGDVSDQIKAFASRFDEFIGLALYANATGLESQLYDLIALEELDCDEEDSTLLNRLNNMKQAVNEIKSYSNELLTTGSDWFSQVSSVIDFTKILGFTVEYKSNLGEIYSSDFTFNEGTDKTPAALYTLVKCFIQYLTNLHKQEEKEEADAEKAAEQARKDAEKAAEQAAKDAEKGDSDKAIIEKWEKSPWIKRAVIEQKFSSTLLTLEALYRNSIEQMQYVGILADYNPATGEAPLIRVKNGKDVNDFAVDASEDTGTMTDMSLYDALSDLYFPTCKVQYKLIEKTPGATFTGFPSYAELLTGEKFLVYPHLMFMTCNIPFSGLSNNVNSIRKWSSATNNSLEKEQTNRITHWSTAVKWIKWVLVNQCYRYFEELGLDANLTPMLAKEANVTASTVISTLVKILQNILIVVERKNKSGVINTMEMLVSSNNATTTDNDKIEQQFADIVNIEDPKNKPIRLQVIDFETCQTVKKLNITYSEEDRHSSDAAFASDIIDNLLASGNRPSWDHVLLGKDAERGDWVFKNFHNADQPKYRCFAIYAGSRAGKGNITSAILTAAVTSGRNLFYIDGKPETGAIFGHLAWKHGQEAFVFDGQTEGAEPIAKQFEDHPIMCGMRTVADKERDINKLPTKIFTNLTDKRLFLGVCRYLRGVELLIRDIDARKSGTIPMDVDAVWIFDELISMCGNEYAVRLMIGDALQKIGATKGFSFPGKGDSHVISASAEALRTYVDNPEAKTYLQNEEDRAAVKFAVDWLSWTDSFKRPLSDASTINLGKSLVNIIMIFQKASSWLGDSDPKKICTLYKFVKGFGTTKFVGNDALADRCGEYGKAKARDSAWYTNWVNTGKGYWAISSDVDVNESDMTVFKPYQLWAISTVGGAKGKFVPLEQIDADKQSKYVEGYMNLVAEKCGLNLASIIHQGWVEAEQLIRTFSNVSSPLDFMYNATTFSPASSDWQMADSVEEYGEGDGQTLASYASTAINDAEDPEETQQPTGQTQQTVEPTFSTGSQTQQPDIDMSEQFGDVDENLENVDIEFEGEDKAQSQALNNPFAQASNANNLTGQSLIDNATRDRLMNELLSQLSPATREKVFDDIAAAKNADLSKMNKLDKEELDNLREQSAYDTKQICVMGKDGKLEFKTEEIAPNSVRRLMAGKDETKCNYVAFSYPKVTNSIFMTNSPRKMAKQLNKIWQKFVYGLIRYKGGKLAIRSLDISDNNIIVNKQLIDTDNILAGGQLDSIADIADMVFLFDQLPGLVTVTMTMPIFELTNDQFDEILIKASKKRGTSLMSVEEYLFRTHEHLNTIIVDGRPITRAKILGMSQQDRESRFKQELNRRQSSREARGLFSKLKNKTGMARTDKRESRHQMRKSKYSAYRLGRFGYGMSKLLSKLLP